MGILRKLVAGITGAVGEAKDEVVQRVKEIDVGSVVNGVKETAVSASSAAYDAALRAGDAVMDDVNERRERRKRK